MAPGLVQKVLEDVGLYDAHYKELRSSPENAEQFRKLEATVEAHAKNPPTLAVDGETVVIGGILVDSSLGVFINIPSVLIVLGGRRCRRCHLSHLERSTCASRSTGLKRERRANC